MQGEASSLDMADRVSSSQQKAVRETSTGNDTKAEERIHKGNGFARQRNYSSVALDPSLLVSNLIL